LGGGLLFFSFFFSFSFFFFFFFSLGRGLSGPDSPSV